MKDYRRNGYAFIRPEKRYKKTGSRKENGSFK